MSTNEFLTIQVGQCGNQIGNTFWPLALEEYNIVNVPEGRSQNSIKTTKPKIQQLNESFFSFFTTNQHFQYGSGDTMAFADLKKFNVKARAILIDMEDSVVNRFHNGPFRNLFDRTCTIKNYPGSGNNWAEGFHTHGHDYSERIENTLRQAVEKCNNLLGFLMLYSVGGGTGSGLGSFILQMLNDLFPNVDRFVTCVYPNGSEDVITCPYNVMLATKYLTDYASCVFPIENRALFDIVKQQKDQKYCTDTVNYLLKCKPFQDMNTLVVNMLLNLTSGSRFSGGLNVDMSDLNTNLVPFPKMHYICSSISPVTVTLDYRKRPTNNRKIYNEIFIDCCHRRNQLLKLDPLGLNSRLIGATLIGRGDFSVSDMRNFVTQLQHRAHFTPWSRNAIRTGLCDVPPTGYDLSMLALFNTSGIAQFFTEIQQQFNRLYLKKAHVHHYTKVDGFETSSFDECKESLHNNIKNYKSVNQTQINNKPRLIVL